MLDKAQRTIPPLTVIWFSHYKRLIASTLSNQCEITKEISQNEDHLSKSFSSKPQKIEKSYRKTRSAKTRPSEANDASFSDFLIFSFFDNFLIFLTFLVPPSSSFLLPPLPSFLLVSLFSSSLFLPRPSSRINVPSQIFQDIENIDMTT